jgi:His-Xaa-Ser system radical SAM maturase HxsC
MRTLRGTSVNIIQPILVKVISESQSHDEKDCASFVFIYEDFNDKQIRSGIILRRDSRMANKEDCPVYKILDSDTLIAVGDILLLEPSGLGTFLFEKMSYSNAIMLTEQCNCHCMTCPQPPRNDQADLINLSLKMISLIDRDTAVLGITGGEPTIVWKGLMEVVEACGRNLPDTSLHLLTNARAFKDYQKTKQLAEVIKNNLLVCVPLYGDVDTLHDHVVASKGAFWDTFEGLYNLARLGIPVEMRTVIIKPNYDRLEKWAEFIYRTFPFVVHVAIMGLEPIGLAARNINSIWIDPVDSAAHLKRAIQILHRRSMNVSIYNHQLCTLPRELWPFSRKAISEWKTIYMPECDVCVRRSACGGFFSSCHIRKSKGIEPLLN